MRKVFNWIVVILSLVAILGTSIPMGISTSATIAGMKSAITGAPGTFIYSNPNYQYVLLGWPVGEEIAFIFVDNKGEILKDWSQIAGVRSDFKEAAQFLKYMESHQWVSTVPKMISPVIVAGIKQLSFTFEMIIFAGSRSTIMMIPAVMLTVPAQEIINPKIQS